MGPLLPLAPLVLAAAVRYEAGLRTEARAEAEPAPGAPADTLVLSPRLGLGLRAEPLRLDAAYEPEFRPAAAALLHQGRLEAGWDLRRDARLTALGRLGYGTTDPALPAAAPDGQLALTPRPATGPLRLLSWEAAAGYQGRVAPRLELALRAGWLASGGADEAARASLPYGAGPRGEASLAVLATKLDTYVTRLVADRTDFLPGGSVSRTELGLGWRRRLDRASELGLGLGAAWVTEDRPPAPATARAVPLAEASWARRLLLRGERLRVSASARAEPYVDPVQAAAYPRAELRAGLAYAPQERLELTLATGAARALGAAQGAALAEAELGAAWHATQQLRVAAGLRGAWQEAPLGPVAGGFLALSYAGQGGI